MEISTNVANNLKLIRKHYGYSLQYVSIRTGVEKSRLSKIENLKMNLPLHILEKLAIFYDIDINLILIEVSSYNQDLYLKMVDSNIKLNLDLFKIAKCLDSL